MKYMLVKVRTKKFVAIATSETSIKTKIIDASAGQSFGRINIEFAQQILLLLIGEDRVSLSFIFSSNGEFLQFAVDDFEESGLGLEFQVVVNFRFKESLDSANGRADGRGFMILTVNLFQL